MNFNQFVKSVISYENCCDNRFITVQIEIIGDHRYSHTCMYDLVQGYETTYGDSVIW